MTAQKVTLQTSHGRTAVIDTGGNAPVLVMLHGLGACKEVFVRQVESPLVESCRIIAVDLPGHGGSARSGEPEKDYTVPAVADLMVEVLGLLNIGRAVVFGWSLGGHIAIQMMAAHPEVVSGVALSGTPPIGHGLWSVLRGFHARFDSLLGSKVNLTRKDAERFTRLCFGELATPELADALISADARMRVGITRSVVRGDGFDQLGVIETSPIPVAVINGADDPMVRLSYVHNVAYANLWEGRCHTVAGAGHTAFMTAPHTVNQILNRFVTEVSLKDGEADTARASAEARQARAGRAL